MNNSSCQFELDLEVERTFRKRRKEKMKNRREQAESSTQGNSTEKFQMDPPRDDPMVPSQNRGQNKNGNQQAPSDNPQNPILIVEERNWVIQDYAAPAF